MIVAAKCNITDIIQSINSTYRYGVLSCEYEKDLKRFLQVLQDNPKFCLSPCDTYKKVHCIAPYDISTETLGFVTWKDIPNFTGSYNLTIKEHISGNTIYNNDIVPDEISTGEYSFPISDIISANTIYHFELKKLCEENVETGFADGCALDLTVPLFTGYSIINNNGYSFTLTFEDFEGLSLGALTVSLYQDSSLISTQVTTGTPLNFLGLTPETTYTLQFSYSKNFLESCSLTSHTFETNTNEWRYYVAANITCENEDCVESGQIYVKVPYENILTPETLFLSLQGAIVIKSPILAEIESAIEIGEEITCEWYCTCNEAQNLQVMSVNVGEDCIGAGNLNAECLNCL